MTPDALNHSKDIHEESERSTLQCLRQALTARDVDSRKAVKGRRLASIIQRAPDATHHHARVPQGMPRDNVEGAACARTVTLDTIRPVEAELCIRRESHHGALLLNQFPVAIDRTELRRALSLADSLPEICADAQARRKKGMKRQSVSYHDRSDKQQRAERDRSRKRQSLAERRAQHQEQSERPARSQQQCISPQPAGHSDHQ